MKLNTATGSITAALTLWIGGFVLSGCSQATGVKQDQVNKITFDTTEIKNRIDSIIIHAFHKRDTNYCSNAITFFRNTELARQYPEFVCSAYSSALIATQGVPADLKTNNYTANLLKQIEKIGLETKNEKIKTWSKYLLARHHCDVFEYFVALPGLLECYDEFLKQGDRLGQSVSSKRIAILYFDTYNDYDSAIVFSKRALQTADNEDEKNKDRLMLFNCFVHLDEADSINYYYNTIEACDTAQNNYLKLSLKSLYQVYLYDKTSQGSMDSIQKYLFSYYHLIRKNYSNIYLKSALVSTMTSYIKALIKNKEYANARDVLQKALALDAGFNNQNKSRVGLYEVQFKYHEATGDLQNAYKYLKVYNEVYSKLNFEEAKNKIKQAGILFENRQEILKVQKEEQQKQLIASQKLQTQKIIRNSFIAGSILLVLLIVVLINRNKLKRDIDMEKIRSRLSRDLHDDIGSTLSSINILSRTAQSNLKETADEKTKAALEKINERSQRLLDSMSDIIWNINPGNDTMEELMSRMREYATTILEAKHIDYSFNFPKQQVDCRLNMEVKNNLYLIFKEAVNNLSKYSGCTHADLSLSFDEKNIHLSIEDNGTGFNEQEIKHRGGLVNMQQRAADIKGTLNIHTVINKGTLIALTMPRFC